MGKGFLTYSSAVILQAISHGYRYGFDIIDMTGVPEDVGHKLSSLWDNVTERANDIGWEKAIDHAPTWIELAS